MNVIIVGGGMAGATLALALSALNKDKISISLIETSEPDKGHPGFDARAIALAHGTAKRLDQIGIWSTLKSFVTPINHVHVSDKGHCGFVNISAQDYAISALGYVIELHDAGRQLFAQLKKQPNIQLYCPAKVEYVHRDIDSVEVTLNDGTRLKGDLLVAADGTYSAIAHQCHIQRQREPYEQVAVIANVKTEIDPQGKAFERFTEFGPLAMLPMSEGRSSLVWCHPMEKQAEIAKWDDKTIITRLQRDFGWRLGRIEHIGKRNSYPLALQKANQIISHRLALVGNASQTLHPIAGQGFNLGLRDVMTLANTLTKAINSGADIGSYQVLSQYQQLRQNDREETIGITDGLVKVFANRCMPLIISRNLGLMAMELVPALRNRLAHQTLGWTD
ncbi:2-octaprenyl-6-methoxyphenol hydroxylase [Proteus hauseri ATCC 700826]|uniref:2-octaprenyl-6-methoxyphenol hydroxylase n=1 Tax=Proteus hauseri ATCC 700826 TaxID=1354271 RepID=A0AAJ3HQV9_PROHU|nr:2-octaprenyl-6-methoxyphenyl hydroxylase [Proteus hauseri]OAT45605.1 2-octaprenyl-6-methoxyphenol hydroxylase [Proteus hauseri ATCC 700826]